MREITRSGQVGDGREAAAVEYVLKNARKGDINDVIDTIDRFAYRESFLINVGDEKGRLLDAAVRRVNPRLALELGTYCGYGALRIAAAAPGARVYSVELASANAVNARRIWEHAGVADRLTCVVGTIGDGGRTLDLLGAEHGLQPGSVDFVFLDHDKNAYVADLESIVARGWLRRGSLVVADNVKIPGAPKYRAYMRQQRSTWRTVEHRTHGEYGSVFPDMMLESEFLADGAVGSRPNVSEAASVGKTEQLDDAVIATRRITAVDRNRLTGDERSVR